MSRYRLTLAAQADLEEIYNFVADDADDEAMADRVVADIMTEIERLAEMPSLGRRRPEVTNPRFRFWIANRFLIAYFPDTAPLEIVRIVGARRDMRKLFGDRK